MEKIDKMFEKAGYEKNSFRRYTKKTSGYAGQQPVLFFNYKDFWGRVQIYPYGGKGVDCNALVLSAREIKTIYEYMKENGYYEYMEE